MNAKRQSWIKSVSYVMVACVVGLTGFVPVSQASIVTTQALMQAENSNAERERVRAMFQRDDIKSALTERGVDAEQALARVDSLTDAEVRELAGKMDQLPAGAGALEIVLAVFLVLIITDILGVTDVFPFVNKR